MDTGRLNRCIGEEGDYEFMASIIIPVYNAQEYIGFTLSSILSQDYPDYEIILVDDCSTDKTSEVIKPYLADNIRYFCEEKNSGGPSIPRNTGVQNSSGKYIFLFDSDDVMLPGKLRESVLALESCPEIGLLCTNFQSISDQGDVLVEDFLKEYTSFRLECSPEGEGWSRLERGCAYKALLNANFVGTSSVAVPRWVFDKLGYFDDQLTNGDDYDFWLRVAYDCDLLFVDKILHQYRLQPNSVSSRGVKNAANKIRVLEKQLEKKHDTESLENINKWLAMYWFQVGLVEFSLGDKSKARASFVKSFRLKKSLPPLKYCLASYFSNRILIGMRKLARITR